jgi:lipid-A-disaccharide synthase
MTRSTIYFVAGEASADNHGAALMRSLGELDAGLRFVGRGGPQMKAAAGEPFRNWIDEAAVVGLWEVIKKYRYFRRQFLETLRQIEADRPDAVVLIDYPGFNLRLARALRRRGISLRIIYYISPQVWAWNRGRIAGMAQCVDLMLCIFPFEAELYNRSGLRTRFVGHPMLERLRAQKIEVERDPNLIGLFPGSRRREVRKIFPVLVHTARQLRGQKPALRFEVAAPSRELAGEIRSIMEMMRVPASSVASGIGSAPACHPCPSLRGETEPIAVPEEIEQAETHPTAGKFGPPPSAGIPEFITVTVGDAAGLMQRAWAGIVASGSATLEAAYFRLPFILVYKVSWATYLAARLVVRVKHLGMPNVLAGREIVPEFIQHRADPRKMAAAVVRLIDQPALRSQMLSSFDEIIASLGATGASRRAAEAILQELKNG